LLLPVLLAVSVNHTVLPAWQLCWVMVLLQHVVLMLTQTVSSSCGPPASEALVAPLGCSHASNAASARQPDLQQQHHR
jgi:hypothetical protein